jgi:hypothetical protein
MKHAFWHERIGQLDDPDADDYNSMEDRCQWGIFDRFEADQQM